MYLKPRESGKVKAKCIFAVRPRLSAISRLLLVFFSIYCTCLDARAEALLDSNYKDAAGHDFISYFGFQLKEKHDTKSGTTEYSYFSESFTAHLILSVSMKSGKIIHMRLSLPRPLIDDEKVTTRGRDLVKSFLLASAKGSDISSLKALADEIYVRGLILTPIKDSQTSTHSSSVVPSLRAYKVGTGPVSDGDNAIFLSQLPKLAKTPSPLFLVFSGKLDSLGRSYKNCKVAFVNQNLKGNKAAIPVFSSESWDAQVNSASAKNENKKHAW